MHVQDSTAWVKWSVLSIVGIAGIGAAIVSLGMATPVALSGAVAVTTALAANGPGGMVDGIATIAALTGASAAVASVGAVEAANASAHEKKRQGERRKADFRQAVAEMAMVAEPEELRMVLATCIATVHAQEELAMTSQRVLFVETVIQTLADLSAKFGDAALIEPHGDWTASLAKKVMILEIATAWFDDEPPPREPSSPSGDRDPLSQEPSPGLER